MHAFTTKCNESIKIRSSQLKKLRQDCAKIIYILNKYIQFSMELFGAVIIVGCLWAAQVLNENQRKQEQEKAKKAQEKPKTDPPKS